MTGISWRQAGMVLLLSWAGLGWAQDRAVPVAEAAPITLGALKNPNVFAHRVCGLQALGEKNPDVLIFAEGDICAPGGGRCVYHALLNIGGDDVRLKQTAVNQRARSASFSSSPYRLKVTYARKGPSTLSLSKAGARAMEVKVTGDCGE